ncbi:MAG: hypothetical protein AB8G95_22415 [Anaerolineae bacterium]
MYKKQLSLTAAIYLAILFTFTACNITKSADPTVEAVEPIVQVVDNSAEIEGIVETKVSEALAAENDTETIIVAEPSDPMQDSGQTAAGDNSMVGSNNMGGGMMGNMSGVDIPVITDLPEDDIDSDQERQALQLLVQEKPIAMLLSTHAEWHVEMWLNEEEWQMEIDLFDANWEWISWAGVGLDENELPVVVNAMYAPQSLTVEEYQLQQSAAEGLVLNNAEVLAILGDPAEWERYAWYDEWEAAWDIYFYKGLDEISVRIDNYDGEMMVGSIKNLALLTEEQTIVDNHDRAIELAWSADGIDEALFSTDQEWRTYVTHIGEAQYGVSFAAADNELFFALVDIEAEQVLESNP